MTAGPLALVGGEEFLPGNEAVDERLVAAARMMGSDRPAFVIASAAARQGPDRAVETARRWFRGHGLEVQELPLRTRTAATSPTTADLATRGRFFYLTGGDPGLVVRILQGTRTWMAIEDAWRGGAVLAGSSAGAMALGAWTLVRTRAPGDVARDARPALGLVSGVAVAPHFASFGRRWVPSALAALTAVDRGAVVLGLDERTGAVWTLDASWQSLGSGGVTLVGQSGERRFAGGQRIEGLPDPAVERA